MGKTTPKMNRCAIRRRKWINGQYDAENGQCDTENGLMGNMTPKMD